MNRRVFLSGLLVVVCLATLWGVWGQRSQLAGLRAEQQQSLAQLAARADGAASPGTAKVVGASSATPQPPLVATPELLRLRNEVTRLTERRRELASARAENERLRAQLTSRGTNGQLPPGYVLRREARFVGYNTPDDALQSLLWATRNHDLTNALQAFTPEIAKEYREQAGESSQSIEHFWSESAALVGMGIVGRKQDASDGSIVLEVEVVPGMPRDEVPFRQINGQWKIAGRF
ncbi:MAG: hypothetical protein ABSD29_23370 [Verrucomicrobiota bacterium]|jgi:hypothetical protein